MDKTLEEFMAAVNGGRGDLDAWLECNNEAECRAVIRMAFAAVKEEDAQICKSQYVDAIGSGCDTDFAYNNALDHAAAAIRASIKEVK